MSHSDSDRQIKYISKAFDALDSVDTNAVSPRSELSSITPNDVKIIASCSTILPESAKAYDPELQSEYSSTISILRHVFRHVFGPDCKRDEKCVLFMAGRPAPFHSDSHEFLHGFYEVRSHNKNRKYLTYTNSGVESFASNVASELKSIGYHNVEVHFADCHAIASEQADIGSIFVPSYRAYAKSILRSFGHGQTTIIPYWPHELLLWVLWLLSFVLPRSFVSRLSIRTALVS